MSDPVNVESALRALVATYVDAWNRGDGDGFASVFAADADFTSVALDRVHSRAAIGAAHTGIFKTIYKGIRLRAEIDHVRLVRPDVAVFDVNGHLSDAAGAPVPPHAAHALAVAEHTPGGWQIVSFQNMVPIPR